MEGAFDTVACTSGMAALTLCFELFDSGAHFICSEDIYGGSTRMFKEIGEGRGMKFTYVNTSDAEAVEAAIREDTKALYIETPSNPTMMITDLAAMGQIAKKHNLYLIRCVSETAIML